MITINRVCGIADRVDFVSCLQCQLGSCSVIVEKNVSQRSEVVVGKDGLHLVSTTAFRVDKRTFEFHCCTNADLMKQYGKTCY